MSAEIESSALPPLDPNQSQKLPNLESSEEIPNQENAPQEIKRNILQLYPRLQSLEKYIKEIRQQLPSELNKNFLQIRRDVFKLKEKSCNQTTDINDTISQLKDLENQMNFKVDLYVDNFVSTLQKKYKFNKYKPKDLVSQPPVNLQNEFNRNLDEIINSFNMNNKSTEQQLSNLEQKITKMTSQSTHFRSENNIEQMRKSIQQQNLQLSELSINLNSLLQDSLQNSSLNNSTPNQSTIIQNDTTTTPAYNKEIPDLTEPIKLLSEQIQEFKKEFKNSLDDARQKAQNCKNHLLAVKEIANEINEHATEIESNVIEVNNLCDSLATQIKEISQSLLQNTAQRSIEFISTQIKSVQDRIIFELNTIKKRIKKCEMSEPLLKAVITNNTDITNDTNSKNNINDTNNTNNTDITNNTNSTNNINDTNNTDITNDTNNTINTNDTNNTNNTDITNSTNNTNNTNKDNYDDQLPIVTFGEIK